RRLSFPSLATQVQFTVPVGVSDIATLPGSPLSVVLASSPAVQLYVDGLLHEVTPFPPADITKITVGPNAQPLYGMVSSSAPAFVTMSVVGDGVHIVSSVDDMPPGNAIAFAGGRYYTSGTGTLSYQRAGMIDPRVPPAVVGRFPGYGAQFLP